MQADPTQFSGLRTVVSEWLAPRAFEAFQYCLGGTIAKRKLVSQYYSHEKRVLEVGCSVGNIARVFVDHGAQYVGVDVDAAAVAYAKTKFAGERAVSFVCGDLRAQKFEHPFDYIILSAVVHHMDDATVVSVLEHARSILAPGGAIVVSDPIQPRAQDSTIIKLYRKLERGQYVRTMPELATIVSRVAGLHVVREELLPVAALPVFEKPTVSYFGVFVLRASDA